jgi:DNA-binding IscR family transcriptional regulator
MNGFVKLRRGLAEHVGTGRMTLTEHGAYTLLLQLADHNTGRWRGTQRSFAAAAGISSGMAWKILTSLERKGYLSWNRERQSVEISKYFVARPVENPVEKLVEIERRSSGPGHSVDQVGHAHDRCIRNRRTLLEKKDVAAPAATHSPAPSTRKVENPKPEPAVMARILSAMRQIAFAKSINGAELRSRFPRRSSASIGHLRAGNHSPP